MSFACGQWPLIPLGQKLGPRRQVSALLIARPGSVCDLGRQVPDCVKMGLLRCGDVDISLLSICELKPDWDFRGCARGLGVSIASFCSLVELPIWILRSPFRSSLLIMSPLHKTRGISLILSIIGIFKDILGTSSSLERSSAVSDISSNKLRTFLG